MSENTKVFLNVVDGIFYCSADCYLFGKCPIAITTDGAHRPGYSCNAPINFMNDFIEEGGEGGVSEWIQRRTGPPCECDYHNLLNAEWRKMQAENTNLRERLEALELKYDMRLKEYAAQMECIANLRGIALELLEEADFSQRWTGSSWTARSESGIRKIKSGYRRRINGEEGVRGMGKYSFNVGQKVCRKDGQKVYGNSVLTVESLAIYDNSVGRWMITFKESPGIHDIENYQEATNDQPQ